MPQGGPESGPTKGEGAAQLSFPAPPPSPTPSPTYCEFDINLHQFPYLAKNAIKSLHHDFFPNLTVDIGFVIESRVCEELPEQILGAARIANVRREDAIDEYDFFALCKT